MEQGLFEFLRDNVAIAALVGGRVYQDHLPQVPTYPAITFLRASSPRDRTMGGGSVQHPRFQIDAWATTREGANTLADTVRTALDWKTGALGSATVLHAEIADERRDSFQDLDPTVYRTSSDYFIWQEE